MRNLIKILILVSMFSCNKDENKKHKIQDEITFKSSKGINLISPNGTTIYIPEDCFEYKDRKRYNGLVKFKLIEVFTKEDMIKYDLTTSSDNRMLVSLGMFKLTAKAENGKDLQIKGSKAISLCAELGVERNDSRYEGFYGVRSESGLNWVPRNRMQNDSIPWTCLDAPSCAGTFLMNVKKFGWINCDYFESINLEGNLILASKEEDITVRLVFEDLNSIMSFQENGNKYKQERLPLNRKATVIAYKESLDKIKYFQRKIVIDTMQRFDIVLEEIEINEFKENIKNL